MNTVGDHMHLEDHSAVHAYMHMFTCTFLVPNLAGITKADMLQQHKTILPEMRKVNDFIPGMSDTYGENDVTVIFMTVAVFTTCFVSNARNGNSR